MANTLSFAIPESVVEYIDQRVASGGYGNRSEFIRELVRLDQREQAIQRVRALVEEGLTSGLVPEDEDDDREVLEAIARGELSDEEVAALNAAELSGARR